MKRNSLYRVISVVSILGLVEVACSSSRTTGSAQNGDLGGAGGVDSGSGGANDSAAGEAGSGGTGGSQNGFDPGGGVECDPSAANQIRVTFAITLAPDLAADAVCVGSCSGVSATFLAPNGTALYPGYQGACGNTPCDACITEDCPGSSQPTCTNGPFASQNASYPWTGTYYTPSTCSRCSGPGCGPALDCQEFACARDGHYKATFCLPRTAAILASGCTPATDQVCATVDFDLPAHDPIPVVLGP